MIITDKAQIKCYELIESDLKLPADATFTRSSVAYLSDGTQVDVNTPRFEQGKFGKAIMVEEGTENLLTNPSFEGTYTSGLAPNWTAYSNGSATGSYAESTSALAGSKSQRITRTGGTSSNRWGIYQTSSAIRATSVTISVYIKVLSFTSGAVVRLYGDFTNGPYGVNQAHTITAVDVGKWIRLQRSATVDSTDTCTFYVWIEGANADILVDCAQVEAKPYPTSFIDGTRSPESLTIPTAGVLNPQEGTVECWINLRAWVNGISDNGVWSLTGSTRLDMWFSKANSNYLGVYDGTAWLNSGVASSSFVDSWHYIAYTWGSFGQKIYVDGVLKASTTRLISSAHIGNLLYVGSYRNGWQVNSLIDDFRISNRARTDEEILATYQSGQPLAADEWTTYKLDFDDKVRITTQGQIICNEFIEI